MVEGFPAHLWLFRHGIGLATPGASEHIPYFLKEGLHSFPGSVLKYNDPNLKMQAGLPLSYLCRLKGC